MKLSGDRSTEERVESLFRSRNSWIVVSKVLRSVSQRSVERLGMRWIYTPRTCSRNVRGGRRCCTRRCEPRTAVLVQEVEFSYGCLAIPEGQVGVK